MTLDEAQREVRVAFLGGSVGQAVTGAIWLLSAAVSTWVGSTPGILVLFFGGMLIFPLTQLALKAIGHSAALGKANPLSGFTLQSVFAMGAMYPLVYAAALHNLNWFYPAFMLAIGTHYMPFIFLYGMWEFVVLAAVLIFGSVGIGMLFPHSFIFAGWFTAVVLLAFALWVRSTPGGSK